VSELHKFLFEGQPVRGMVVRLTDAWREVLARRQAEPFDPPVRSLLGEMAAATVLMQANIKFNGALILQVFGDGPVKLAVAQAEPDLSFRVTAKVTGEVHPGARVEALMNVQGQGRCAITLDPKDKQPGQQPYQGVVPLQRHDQAGVAEPLQELSQVLELYMRQSEQLETRLLLACNDELAAGLLVQRLPAQTGTDAAAATEAFNRIAHLAGTLTRDELLTLDVETILRRLFWQEPLRRFEPLRGALAPRFACTCSRSHVGAMLRGLGRAEVDDIVAEQGRAEVGCEFCGLKYHFDSVDVGELFTPISSQAPGSGTLN
jgi:molecular chaperone Hsp33